MPNFATKNRYLPPKLSIAGCYCKCTGSQFARFTKTTLVYNISNYGAYMRRDERKKTLP